MNGEPKLVLFAKTGGRRECQIDLLKERRTGKRGQFGELYKVQIEYRGQVMDFYEKRFFDDGDAERAQEKYQLAKDAGLKVFPTYRLNKERNSILMTPADNDGQKEVDSGKQGSIEMHSIDNFVDFVKQLFAQVRLAYEHDIGFADDCLMYFYNPKSRKMDFYIGDTDNIVAKEQVQYNGESYYQAFVDHMIKTIYDNIEDLIHSSVRDRAKRNQYLELLYAEYETVKKDLGLSQKM
ncbi:MAG: hypothetical protein V1898_00405 [Patescibacteria group bacterium]